MSTRLERQDSWEGTVSNVVGRVVAGHGVASGCNGDPRFPGGTLAMQIPTFLSLGLDLRPYHRGTINVSISPWSYVSGRARVTFRDVHWAPHEPPEDFSFFDCRVRVRGSDWVSGLIYHPHPETKPKHFQAPDVLEVLTDLLPGLRVGDEIHVEAAKGQMGFVLPDGAPPGVRDNLTDNP
jgi:hypothetical protein